MRDCQPAGGSLCRFFVWGNGRFLKKAPQKLFICVAVEIADMMGKEKEKNSVEYGLGVFGPLT